MVSKAALKRKQSTSTTSSKAGAPSNDDVSVGKDILELLSSSMYVDPLTIYREYIQNAADGIDEAVARGLLDDPREGKIEINLDHIERRARIRDNGIGLAPDEFVSRMMSFGASRKRGTDARGFRGVGRLAGLGYCQELIFRSRAKGTAKVTEVRWDGRRLKALLSDPEFEGRLEDVVRDVVTIDSPSTDDHPERFFEVEIVKPRRLGNDVLLNEDVISRFLSQTAPLPFHPDFKFGEDIRQLLAAANVKLGEYQICINDAEEPLYRPYRNEIVYSDFRKGFPREIREIHIDGNEGQPAAVGWVLHHDYQGAIPPSLGVRGLRARVGNIQVGNERIFAEVFPEERFCSWTVGELHILDGRILPNGRRDDFEPNAHLSNIYTHLVPVVSEVARECRSSSQVRNRKKAFELGDQKVHELLDILRQGGISKTMAGALKREVTAKLSELRHVAGSSLLADCDREGMNERLEHLESLLTEVMETSDADDPLSELPQAKQRVYREVIGLIYECSGNRVAARSLVEKMLARITAK